MTTTTTATTLSIKPLRSYANRAALLEIARDYADMEIVRGVSGDSIGVVEVAITKEPIKPYAPKPVLAYAATFRLVETGEESVSHFCRFTCDVCGETKVMLINSNVAFTWNGPCCRRLTNAEYDRL